MASEEGNPETSPRESALARILGVLVRPSATFESIAEKPNWLLPLLLLILVSLALTFSFGQRVGWRALIEKQLATSSRLNQLTPVQQQQAIDRAVRLAPIGGYLGSTLGSALILLAIAGIFLGAFNIVYGTTIKFRQSFAISIYAFVPEILKGLLALLIVWVRPPEGVTPQNLVMSNVGAFLPSTTPAWRAARSSAAP